MEVAVMVGRNEDDVWVNLASDKYECKPPKVDIFVLLAKDGS